MSLVLTRTQNMRANSNFDKYERRGSRYGALDLFMQQTNEAGSIITDELKEKARMSIGSVLETPVIDYDGDITIGNTRDVLIPDSENTSRMIQITFATYSWGFTITPAMYMNNEIKLQKDWEAKMLKYIYKFAALLDSDALAVLELNKTQVINNPLLYTVNAGAVKATFPQREDLMGDLNAIMAANDFFGSYAIVGDAGTQSLLTKLAQKDLYNEVNKRNEYADKVIHISNNFAQDANVYTKGYIVNRASVGMLLRYERDCLLRTKSLDGHEWDIVNLPIVNIPVGTYFYDSVGDYSAIAGAATADMTRTRKEHYGFAVDVAFVTAYNSDPTTLPSPILAYSVDKTKDAVYARPVLSYTPEP